MIWCKILNADKGGQGFADGIYDNSIIRFPSDGAEIGVAIIPLIIRNVYGNYVLRNTVEIDHEGNHAACKTVTDWKDAAARSFAVDHKGQPYKDDGLGVDALIRLGAALSRSLDFARDEGMEVGPWVGWEHASFVRKGSTLH